MDCKYHSSDRHSGAEDVSMKRAKATIVDVARKTLLDLNTSMKEMKSWETQRSIFTSKISNQNEKIRSLKRDNDSLTSDVERLKSNLADAAESNTRMKFEDEKIDALVVGSAHKIIRTIGDLSSELVIAHDAVNVFRNQNERLRIKSDQLQAMVRVSSGSCKDFRSRVDELNVFVLRIDEEILALKNSLENANPYESVDVYTEKTKNVEALMKELEIKLRNDRDALFSGGNSYWSDYLKRIAKLESSADDLLRQLDMTKSEMRARSCGVESSSSKDQRKRLDELAELVKRVGSNLKSLKTEPMMIGSRVGGESCAEYSKRIRTLCKLVATSKSIIDKLIIESSEDPEETPEGRARVASTGRANIEALEALTKKFKSGVKELEMAVASGDNTRLIRKIRQLENSVARLKSEVEAREEENNSMGLELTGAKIAFGEKVEALEKLQAKYEKMVNRTKNRKQRPTDDDQQRVETLQRELEETKVEAQNSKILRDELNVLRRFAENLETEKAALLEELQKNQVIIEDRENQVEQMSKEKNSIERDLTREKNEIERKLAVAVEEIQCLKKQISELKEAMESRSNEGQSASEATELEFTRLKALLEETNKNLESTTDECRNLRSKCNEAANEKTKTELELSRMKIQNEALIDHLNSEKVTTAETLQGYQKLVADLRSRESDLLTLKTELATLKKCLEDSEREKDSLEAEVTELRRGNLTLRDDALTLRCKVNTLSEDLEEANLRETETSEKLKKLEDDRRNQSACLDSLAIENEKLKDQLDRVRSDKLNIAGTMNDWRLRCETTKSLLDSKAEQLDQTLRDIEMLKTREAAANLEVAKTLEANVELRGAIDVLKSDKARLEERFAGLNSECHALRSELEALRDDSSALRRRADASTENARELENRLDELRAENADLKKNAEGARNEIASRDDRIRELETLKTTLKRSMDEVTLRRRAEAELATRLSDELAALKVELARMRAENEMLKTSHEAARTKSRVLESENAALKVKLEEVRREKISRDDEETQLRCDYEKLKLRKVTLEGELTDARRKIAEYEVATANLNGLEDKLRRVLKDHAAMKDLLRSRNDEVVHLRRAIDPYRSLKYGEDVRAT